MADEIKTQQELYEIFKNEVQNRNPELTDFEIGSNLDAIAGADSVAAQELNRIVISQFAKTFFTTAQGDDLDFLAIDRYGDSFARPGSSNATVNLTFSRPDLDEGIVVIPQGTIAKTEKNVSGVEYRFQTTQEVTMGISDSSITTTAIAIQSGPDSNVGAGKINLIETSLTEPDMTVANVAAATGGSNASTDEEYRAFITNLIETLRGATCPAIQAAAENVPGVEIATVIEKVLVVTEFDEVLNTVIRDPFKIVRPRIYIADTNGTATDLLIEQVDEALFLLRACGVDFDIKGATPLVMNWRANYTLNPAGPNFAELNSDPSSVEFFMTEYIKDIPIGTGFSREDARLAVLARWGSAGTNDLTDFLIAEPTGNIADAEFQKLVPGVVEIV